MCHSYLTADCWPVFSVFFHVCLAGGQEDGSCADFLSQYPAQTWMWLAVCIAFDGTGNCVSSNGRLCHSALGTHTPIKLEGLGKTNQQKWNACSWTGIKNNKKTQHLRIASIWKGVYFRMTAGQWRDHSACSQYTMCHNTHCEQEPVQVAMSVCGTGG